MMVICFVLENSFDEDNDLSVDSDLFDEFSYSHWYDESHDLQINPPKQYEKRIRKRRLNANPRFLPSIRILRRDIRRKYGEMLTNVLNNCDTALHRCFLQEFAVPHVTDYYQDFPSELLTNCQYPRKVQGIEDMVEVFRRQCLSTPDIIFRLSDVKVCQRLNTPGSRIVASILVKGTMLYNIISDSSLGTVDNTQFLEESRSIVAIENPLSKTALLKTLDNPIELSLKVMLTVYLDEQNRFVSTIIDATWL